MDGILFCFILLSLLKYFSFYVSCPLKKLAFFDVVVVGGGKQTLHHHIQ